MDAPPTYLGLDLVEVRPLTRLERLEFETRRDRSRRIVRRQWVRWGLILSGYAAYFAAIGFFDLDGGWVQGPLQAGLPLVLAYEAAHRQLARGKDDESVAIYRGAGDASFKAFFARAKMQTRLPKRALGETVELAVLLPSGRLWSVDGFRVRGVLVPLTKLPATPPLGKEDGRPLTMEESQELRNWKKPRTRTAQSMTIVSALVLVIGGGLALYFEAEWWVNLAVLFLASAPAALAWSSWREASRISRALVAPRLRALSASPDGKGPVEFITVVEGTGLPWTVAGHPAPWRYGEQPKRVKESLVVRQDSGSGD